MMEFHEKLQALRKQKGLTQEELATSLYVSRAAVSKWESGRGYPSIDSLKAISSFYAVTVDQLLSGEEVLTIAKEDQHQRGHQFCSLIYALLDLCAVFLCILPLFGQEENGILLSVSLFSLTDIQPYLKTGYFLLIAAMVLWGILTLILQNWQHKLWKYVIFRCSILLNTAALLLFMVSLQPYAAVLSFVFLAVKVLSLIKKQ